MKEAVKNGMRSGLVVVGAVAFGYLTLQLGFKPYLEKAQQQIHISNPNNLNHHQLQDSVNDDVVAIVLDDDDASPS